MLQLYLGVVLCYFLNDLSPQSGAVEDVRLVNARYLLAALHCYVESLDRYAADLLFVVAEGVDCGHNAVDLAGAALAEIQTSGKLAHYEHVKALLAYLGLERACRSKLAEQKAGAQVREKAQGLANLQQSSLRTEVSRKLVPRRLCGVAADASHQNRVGRLAALNGFVCERNSVCVDGAAAHQKLLVVELMSEFCCDLVQHLHSFSHYLGTDTIALDNCDILFHRIPLSNICRF